MATRELRVSFTGDTRDLDRTFAKVDRGLKKTGDTADREGKRISGFATVTSKGMGRVGVAAGGMAAAGAGAMTLLTKSFVSGATDISESLSKNERLFGRHASEIDKFSRTTAEKFGISRQAALDATGTFGNLFSALEIGPRKSAGMSKALTILAADMASFNNSTPEEALEAIRAGLVGETEPLRKFGVNLNDAALRAEALRMGLVKNTKEALEPQTKALAINSLLFKQTDKAQGDFARTSGGLANQQRILKARLADSGAELGAKLMPAALTAVKALNSLFDSSSSGGRVIAGLGKAARVAGDWVQNAFQDARQAVARFANRNQDAIRDVQRAFQNVAKAARVVFIEVLIPVLKRAWEYVKDFAGGAFKALGGLVRLVSNLINGDWREAWRSFKDILRGMLQVVKATFDALWDTVKTSLNLVVDKAPGIAKKVGVGIGKGILAGVKATIGSGGGGILDVISGSMPGAGALKQLGKLTGDGIGKQVLPSIGTAGLGGGSLKGADPDLAPFAGIGARFGLSVTSGLRPGSITSSGNVSLHSTGDAIDLSGPAGGMMQTFKFLKGAFGSRLSELIYTPGGAGIKDGRPYTYSGAVAADHYDHVHVGFEGPFGDGLGRKPGTGDGIGQAVRAARSVGLSGEQLVTMVAIAGAESGYDAQINAAGPEDSRGFWQINVGPGANTDMLRLGNLYDPMVNARAMKAILSRQGLGAWSVYTNGRYKDYLSRARAAVAALGRGGALGAGGGARGSAGNMGRVGPGRMGLNGETINPAGNRGKVSPGSFGLGANRPVADPDALSNAPSGTDFIDAMIAEAALTPGGADDKAAMAQLVDYWTKELTAARISGDPRRVSAAAQGLKGARDQLESFDDTARRLTDEIAGLREAIEQQNKIHESVIGVSSREAVRMMADMISGQVVGVGLQGRRGTAGTGAAVIIP